MHFICFIDRQIYSCDSIRPSTIGRGGCALGSFGTEIVLLRFTFLYNKQIQSIARIRSPWSNSVNMFFISPIRNFMYASGSSRIWNESSLAFTRLTMSINFSGVPMLNVKCWMCLSIWLIALPHALRCCRRGWCVNGLIGRTLETSLSFKSIYADGILPLDHFGLGSGKGLLGIAANCCFQSAIIWEWQSG